MASLTIREFTDPACPFAFSAEPARLKLRWLYGDQIEWQLRMVVLSESPHDYEAKGFTPERQAEALESIQRRYGMPIDPRVRPRMIATVHACRAVVAARLHAPEHERALLRRLRIRAMAGDLIDEPAVIALCAREAGLDPMMVFRVAADDPAVEVALREDMAAARAPSVAALALDHKLAAAADSAAATPARRTRSSARAAAAGRASTCPASSPSRSTRRRSPTSRRSWTVAPRPNPSTRCLRGRASRSRPPRWRRSAGCRTRRPAPSWSGSPTRTPSGRTAGGRCRRG